MLGNGIRSVYQILFGSRIMVRLKGDSVLKIPYWIQRADFFHVDFDPVDEESAIKAYRSHDWMTELIARQRRESSGEEACDPGIGFVAGDGRILHICPGLDGNSYFHYRFNATHKVLWFFEVPTQKTRSAFEVADTEFPDVIQRFFRDDHEWLLSNTSA